MLTRLTLSSPAHQQLGSPTLSATGKDEERAADIVIVKEDDKTVTGSALNSMTKSARGNLNQLKQWLNE